MRFVIPAVAITFLLTLSLSAGEDGLSGNWKLSIFDDGQQVPFWILSLKSKDGKLDVTATALKGAPKVEVKSVKQTGDTISLSMQAMIQDRTITFEYEGKLPKPGAKKILGSLSWGTNVTPVLLEATTAKNKFELDRELLMKSPTDPKALTAIHELIDGATVNKVDAKDVQEWVNSSLKAVESYGPRLALQHQIRLLHGLQEHKTYLPIAVEVARKLSKSIDPKMPADAQLEVLSLAADVLRKGEQKDDVEKLDARLDKLENAAYTEHMKEGLDFKPTKFSGRKGKSTRTALVELFTGAQCPPCVAADIAFDALQQAYPVSEVVLLQYHVHIPRPDALANADGEARYEYYLDYKRVRGAPSTLVNGQPIAGGGGAREDAFDKFKEYAKVVNAALETPDAAKVSISAKKVGDKISVKASVKDLANPGDKIRLRLALVEDWARYKGGNGVTYHHRVVRAMPGGPKGFTLKEKSAEYTAEVNLDTVRKNLNKYLSDDPFVEGPRPMRLRNLRVVAFVQDDDSAEVLGAVEGAVKE